MMDNKNTEKDEKKDGASGQEDADFRQVIIETDGNVVRFKRLDVFSKLELRSVLGFALQAVDDPRFVMKTIKMPRPDEQAVKPVDETDKPAQEKK